MEIHQTLQQHNITENSETLDSYITHKRQVAVLLGYGESQVLDVFKDTLPTRLYCIIFPTEALRQAVETTKRILMEEKMDRQLMGQSSSTPFMSTHKGCNRNHVV